MKYVIRYASPCTEGIPSIWLPYLYHKYCWVGGPGEEIQGSSSPKLFEAKLFDTYQEAGHIIKMVYSEIINGPDKYAECLAIVGITKKEIFKAKLAGK